MTTTVEQRLRAYGDEIEKRAAENGYGSVNELPLHAVPSTLPTRRRIPRRSLVAAAVVVVVATSIVAVVRLVDETDTVNVATDQQPPGTEAQSATGSGPAQQPAAAPMAQVDESAAMEHLGERLAPQVVWTGTELIVFGGRTGSEDDPTWLTDGAVFSPATGEWRLIPAATVDDLTRRPQTLWDGERLVVIDSRAVQLYDPAAGMWASAPDLRFENHQALPAGGDTDLSVFAASGGFVYHWNPVSDEFARLDVIAGRWTVLPGPGLESYPAKLVVTDSSVLAFGTGWPSSFARYQADLEGAELVNDEWIPLDPVGFATTQLRNVADPAQATLLGDMIVVWGEYSASPGAAQALGPDRAWSPFEAPPVCESKPGFDPVSLGDEGVLARGECEGEAALLDPDSLDWTVVEIPEFVRYNVVWTGEELLGWDNGLRRWTPPLPRQ
jgi:hypothetical protein